MPNNRYSAKVICPFYRNETKLTITCESPIRGTGLMLRFSGKEWKEQHQKHVCCTFCYAAVCPIAGLLVKKYEEEDRK